jgi:phosphopentomutase
VLASLDRFVGALLDRLDPARDLLVLASDHGNLEDLGTKTHTRNPVPLVALGAGAGRFADARSVLDVTPRVVGALA